MYTIQDIFKIYGPTYIKRHSLSKEEWKVYNAIIKFKNMEDTDMTKTELISVVAEKTDFTKKNAEAAVNAVVSAITDALASGEKVSIVGFGTFEVRDRKEKQVINTQTKKMMTAPASKAPAFKAGQALKNAVNK